ncbi:hypothetical protein NDU88_002606 [Pleurodeles waltl]|uniref:Uncharacterized protein n=1 Tax=Pleurodeles waltl TaxID=8319 RepID=A0AAV7LG55_PLEWA|nr:hypothetical protein NDU88_002606 [Pleurodeles waltl]
MLPSVPPHPPGPGPGLLRCESSAGTPHPLFTPPVPRSAKGHALVSQLGPPALLRSPPTRPQRASVLCWGRPHAVRWNIPCAVFTSDALQCRVSGSSAARAAPSQRALSVLCLSLGPFTPLAPCPRLEPRLTSSREHSDGSCDLGSV